MVDRQVAEELWTNRLPKRCHNKKTNCSEPNLLTKALSWISGLKPQKSCADALLHSRRHSPCLIKGQKLRGNGTKQQRDDSMTTMRRGQDGDSTTR